MMSDESEVAYEQGSRMAWTAMLAMCLRNLGYENTDIKRAAWIVERETAVSILRGLCREFGDNDWPDDLSLADVIDKHLGDHLRAP
jgi:hypothetical protein